VEDLLTNEERGILLSLGRQAIEAITCGSPLPLVDRDKLPDALLQPGATFVTLTIQGDLRGCVGTLEPYQPLVDDVIEHAVAAATQDFRFPPLAPEELPRIHIEISRLTAPKDLDYDSPLDLLSRLHPNVDGVTIFDGWRRATFLPQVWEKLPDPIEFLDHLCYKMGAAPDLWRSQKLRVQTYQVEEFHD
jgi:AmmeMemoRadiSam system protein A